ncbi:SusC/RagA family TonB-linked outer membrane protein [Sphingobacterium spiritivorum]|uniref:TonB-linked outer membrane protein, SusC/RagA family n=1 Tax=Sphingobacterium spiritivorum ATCC 33861 TaxID=525373 RepID=D7VI07_SPHSI|nr:SusC/RagA family TonB-linked outer membrane protein [Sphingobacterium spiritivorum]EFK59709.1 TonB-linked outer membrane protein, SusC/RagA family [Sphingobacterium spiritivorum ATCC 33861]QQT37643.1 SusC/RagA family TonB-linked outer membrane protein [Sphingobacterium spiritivorum]WQD34442.1 SusC/RagA family TonB-linked outer membrane protein [Sphingobacterium spiritivorum]SUI97416.1 TonB-linked outer membrane protein, SusC/RagA family [Sphingobacterium spiritivorum]
MMKRFYCFLILVFPVSFLQAADFPEGYTANTNRYLLQDTVSTDTLLLQRLNPTAVKLGTADSVHIQTVSTFPFHSVAQYLKGEVAGVYVQENTAEPGTNRNIVLRGLAAPLFSNKDINASQPTIFVNGVPLTQENNFSYGIQKYDYNRLGPGTDFASIFNINSIESIEVIKDPAKLAALGPLAANGAIWITTKGGKSGPSEISLNSYYGLNTRKSVTPVNAQYENMFRQQFYSKYGTEQDRLTYPSYLGDSTNVNYYGPSNWFEEYYKNQPLYSIDLSLRGGSDRANFNFLGGHTSNTSSADAANFKRYNATFNVNMAPAEWFNFTAYVNASRVERKRNRSLRDRISETGYLPDLSIPMSPNRDVYTRYLKEFDKNVDGNVMNAVQAFISADFSILSNLRYTTKFSIDYNEGLRDVFYASSLMDDNNYVSNYNGYNQRYKFDHALNYKLGKDTDHQLDLTAGMEYMEDLYRFTYTKTYDGPNDFIKLNLKESTLPTYRYTNREDLRVYSFYGNAKYKYKNLLDLNAVLRYDGSSTVQKDNRWLFTPAVSAKWNVKNQFFTTNDGINELSIKAGWGRIGKLLTISRFATGPQYATDLNWSTEAGLVSYNGFAAISRPYTLGWVGYDVAWPYTDHFNIDLEGSFFSNRLSAGISLYNKNDKNQIASIPVPAEYGYTGRYMNGLNVNNKGVDVALGLNLLTNPDKLQWSSSFNFNINKNTLKALPNNLQTLIVGDRKLEVGKSVDQFWIYQNAGIYNAESEIPVNPNTGRKIMFQGVEMNAGDAKWIDQNGDYDVNEDDKILAGNAMPKFVGGWSNQFRYKNFDLGFQWYFALGHKALNQRVSNRYDFINNESNNTINSVKEIFHWQQDFDITKYPIYNPWSSSVPYRVDQDLFLENASFLKLRSVSVGYEIAGLKEKVKRLRKAYVYVTGTNLLTITKFTGVDPELIDFNGYYSGYGLPLSPTFTLGFKLDL